jgi:adenylyl-sulfate kinase
MKNYGLNNSLLVAKPSGENTGPGDARQNIELHSQKAGVCIIPESSARTHLHKTTLWITGLPCADKTTLARQITQQLNNCGFRAVHLDGDYLRDTLNSDLGFSPEDRRENWHRVAHVAKLFNDSDCIVVASLVSPSNHLRKTIRDIVGVDSSKLIYAKCSLATFERRDVKGMYKKARMGLIKQFTGISPDFEEPDKVGIAVDTEKNGITEYVEHIIKEWGV